MEPSKKPSDKMSKFKIGRYLFRERWGHYLKELTIIEISKTAYRVRYESGNTSWLDKQELEGFPGEYELVERLEEKRGRAVPGAAKPGDLPGMSKLTWKDKKEALAEAEYAVNTQSDWSIKRTITELALKNQALERKVEQFKLIKKVLPKRPLELLALMPAIKLMDDGILDFFVYYGGKIPYVIMPESTWNKMKENE